MYISNILILTIADLAAFGHGIRYSSRSTEGEAFKNLKSLLDEGAKAPDLDSLANDGVNRDVFESIQAIKATSHPTKDELLNFGEDELKTFKKIKSWGNKNEHGEKFWSDTHSLQIQKQKVCIGDECTFERFCSPKKNCHCTVDDHLLSEVCDLILTSVYIEHLCAYAIPTAQSVPRSYKFVDRDLSLLQERLCDKSLRAACQCV